MMKPWTVVLAWILAGINQSERDGLKNDLVEVRKNAIMCRIMWCQKLDIND